MIRGLLLVLLTVLLGTAANAKPGTETWKLSFELAFGEHSPYSRTFPNLYEQPYSTNFQITNSVLDRIFPIALKESGAKMVEYYYGPGGYQNFPVTPSLQLEILATPKQLHDMADIIGYLSQQTEVLASQPLPSGKTTALDIMEMPRDRQLEDPANVERFWGQLRARAPYLQGFLPLYKQRQSGLRIMDTDGAWSKQQIDGLEQTVNRVGTDAGLQLQPQFLKVRLVRSGNDWKTRPAGESYLHRLKMNGRVDLVRKLRTNYRPQVEGWIREAFRTYAPKRTVGKKVQRRWAINRFRARFETLPLNHLSSSAIALVRSSSVQNSEGCKVIDVR